MDCPNCEKKDKEISEYKKSLEINISILSNLRIAFAPLERAFDNATTRQVREAERRMKALSND